MLDIIKGRGLSDILMESKWNDKMHHLLCDHIWNLKRCMCLCCQQSG